MIHLDSRIDQEPDVVKTDADNLNSVLEAKGVIDEGDLIDEPEDVEGQEGGDCSRLCCSCGAILEIKLEMSKYISAFCQSRSMMRPCRILTIQKPE